MELMVKAVKLEKRYPGAAALNGVTFTVERGRVAGLLGPNGSGKSTLFRIIAGQSRPDAGEVYVSGMPPGPATKALVSFVPEYDHLYKWMTVGEITAFFATVYPSFRAEQTEETLDFMQLPRRSKVGKLSRGMRARLKLALALSWEADLVLLDEPLSGIDPASREKIATGLLRSCAGEKRTVIIASHLVDEIDPLLDQVIFLEAGKIVLQGEADAVRERFGASLDQIMRRELLCTT